MRRKRLAAVEGRGAPEASATVETRGATGSPATAAARASAVGVGRASSELRIERENRPMTQSSEMQNGG